MNRPSIDSDSRTHSGPHRYLATWRGGRATLRPCPPPDHLETLRAMLSFQCPQPKFPTYGKPHVWPTNDVFVVRPHEVEATTPGIAIAAEYLTHQGATVEWNQDSKSDRMVRARFMEGPPRARRFIGLHDVLDRRYRGCIILPSMDAIDAHATYLPKLLPAARFLYVLQRRCDLSRFAGELRNRFPGEVEAAPRDHFSLRPRIYVTTPKIVQSPFSESFDVVVWPRANELLNVRGLEMAASLNFFDGRVFAFRTPSQIPGPVDRRTIDLLVGPSFRPVQEHAGVKQYFGDPALPVVYLSKRESDLCSKARSRESRATYAAKYLLSRSCRRAKDVELDGRELQRCKEECLPRAVFVVAEEVSQARRLRKSLTGWPILDAGAGYPEYLAALTAGGAIVTVALLNRWAGELRPKSAVMIIPFSVSPSSRYSALFDRIGTPLFLT